MAVRRIRAWKISMGFFGSLLGLVGGLALWAWRATEVAWSNLGKEVDELIASEIRRETRRPNLTPIPEPGNAWSDYLLAIEKTLPHWLSGQLQGSWDSPKEENRAQVAKILQEHTGALEHFHQGCSRANLSPLRMGQDLREFNQLHEGWMLAMVALAAARASLEGNDPKRGAERLVDLLQFTRDWVECGSREKVRTSHGHISSTVAEITRAIERQLIGPTEMLTIANALRILDENPPSRADLLRRRMIQLGAALHADGIRDILRQVSTAEGFRSGMRDVYSERRTALRLFAEARRFIHEASSIDRWTWAEERAFFGNYHQRFPVSPHSLNLEFDVMSHMMLINLTWIRLARIVLHWKLTGKILERPDPFGSGPLQCKVSPDTLEVWSVGYSGDASPEDPHALVLRIRN